MKGRGLQIVHIFGDSLWEYGGKVYPNDGFQQNCVVPIYPVDDDEEPAENEDVDKAEEKVEEKSEEPVENKIEENIEKEDEDDNKGSKFFSDDEDENDDTPMLFEDDINFEEDAPTQDVIDSESISVMDEKLLKCLLQACHTKLKDCDLPIHAGVLYQTLMIPCREKYFYIYLEMILLMLNIHHIKKY